MKLNAIDENGASPLGPKMRTFTHMLTAIGLLALAVHAPPAAALVIGAEGWTADMPAGVTYGGLVGGNAPGDGTSGVLAGGAGSYTFEIQLASAINVSTTIHFVNTDNALVESYFRLSFKGTNNGVLPWTGMNIVITDVTTDPIQVDPPTTLHPDRAHIHRNLWTAGAFSCASTDCGANGRYDMFLSLAAPLTTGNSATGGTLRLHDGNEAGTDPMKFNLTLTPVPEPDAFLLFGLGLVGLIGVACNKRRAAQPDALRSVYFVA